MFAPASQANFLSIVRHSAAWPRASPTLTQQLGLQPCAWTSSPQRRVQGSLRPACRRRRSDALRAGAAPPLQQCVLPGLCRSCRRARSTLPSPEALHKLSCCRQSAGARCPLISKEASQRPAGSVLGADKARQAVQGGARAAVLEHAGRGPRYQAVAGAWAARCAPSSACLESASVPVAAQTRGAWGGL